VWPASKVRSLVAATRLELTAIAQESHLSEAEENGHGVCSLTAPSRPTQEGEEDEGGIWNNLLRDDTSRLLRLAVGQQERTYCAMKRWGKMTKKKSCDSDPKKDEGGETESISISTERWQNRSPVNYPRNGTIVGEQTDLHLTWLWLISWSSAVVDIVGVWLRLLELPGGKSCQDARINVSGTLEFVWG
jgi:hypothetical protein